MTDQWFYRMFGEEFGPLPLEKLRELAESGTIHAFDQVRPASSGNLVDAGTIEGLGLSTGDRQLGSAIATTKTKSDFEISTPQAGSDDWFCRVADQELGPLSFDKLLEFAEHERLSADDQVKLGRNGKWRRAGSIGRLMAALPYQATEQTIIHAPKQTSDRAPVSPTAPRSAVVAVPAPQPVATPNSEATYRVAFEQATAKVVESMLAQTDAAYQAAEEQARSQIAWATAPNVDRYWWGWAGGVEFGPVEFSQIFGLAKSGQLKPSDFVRNGQHGQYVPSVNIPGLFTAIEMITRAVAARDLARSQAKAASAVAVPPSVAPQALLNAAEKTVAAEQLARSNPVIPAQAQVRPKSNPIVETVRQPQPASVPQIETRTPEPSSVEPTRSPYSSSMNSGFSSNSSSTMSTFGSGRPAKTPVKSYARKPSRSESTWLPDLLENLKEPKAIGSLCAIAFVLLIVGWQSLPKNRSDDVKRYQALKGIIDEIKTKRTSAPAELASLQQKLEKTGKQIAEELKGKASREEPVKQCLLWAARDEVPRIIQSGLGVESPAETTLSSRLKEAAYELGLEKRPPVDMAQLQAMAKANQD